ncbi:LamG domain-containing protein, partial [Escherichia coli]|uniref:LamG domain-containing protein n=1 Tax=Escherichia coli TaxID=562 RepID=UPI0013D00D42
YNESTDLAKLYVNGQLQGQMTVTNPIASTGVMVIGAAKQSAAWTEQLPGRIDEVKVWQDEKSAVEVQQDSSLFDAATGKPAVDLAGAWDLTMAGPAFADKSGNGRALTATTGTPVTGGALVLNGSTQA